MTELRSKGAGKWSLFRYLKLNRSLSKDGVSSLAAHGSKPVHALFPIPYEMLSILIMKAISASVH